MKNYGNAGCRIINFKTVYGIDKDDFENFVNRTNPVMKIKLEKDRFICFTDMDGDSHIITNHRDDIVYVMIFDSNIIFNQEQVSIKNI